MKQSIIHLTFRVRHLLGETWALQGKGKMGKVLMIFGGPD